MDVTVTELLEYLPAVAASVYFLFHVLFVAGFLRTSHTSDPATHRTSVVIAAHNEERSVGRLLTALASQTVPPHEIIIVDDRSDDETPSILQRYASADARVRVLRIDATPDRLAPKKHAIGLGVSAATGDIVLCTDADCIPPRAWVERMTGAFNPGISAVVGSYRPQGLDSPEGLAQRLLHRFIRYERFRLSVHALGSAAAGFPWLASGASFAYRKDVFDAVGGFDSLHHSLSGDDDLLVQRIWSRATGRIGIVADADAAVETNVPATFRGFFQQRLRHGSATRHYLPVVKIWLAAYHLANIISLAALPVAIVITSAPVLSAYAVKISADMLLFVVGDSRLRRSSDWLWFIPLEFLYVLYSLTLAPLGYLRRTVRWGTRPA